MASSPKAPMITHALPGDVCDFRSGTGFTPPSCCWGCTVRRGLLSALCLTQLWLRCCGGRRETSVQLTAFKGFLRKGRVDFSNMADFRQSMLALICPCIPGVSYEPITRGGVPGWLFLPPIEQPQSAAPAIVYVHGGGMCGGDAAGFQGLLSSLAQRCGRPVHAVHYRFCPESTKEEAAEDTARFIGGMEGPVVLLSDSGGSFAAHHALVRHSDLTAGVQSAVFMSPMLGLVDLTTVDDSDDATVSANSLMWCYNHARIVVPESLHLTVGVQYPQQVAITVAKGETLEQDARRFQYELKAAGVDASLEVATGQVHAYPTIQGLGIPEMEDSLDWLVGICG